MTHRKPIPVFELLVTLFFSYLAALLFFYPDLFKSDRSLFYENLTLILPTVTWIYIVFGVATLSAVGLIANVVPLRRISLVLSGIVFVLFTIAFARSFPNISVGVYGILALFSFVSILQVRQTEL